MKERRGTGLEVQWKWRTANFAGPSNFEETRQGESIARANECEVKTKIGGGGKMKEMRIPWRKARKLEERERKSGCQSSSRCAVEAISQGWKIKAISEVSKFSLSSVLSSPVLVFLDYSFFWIAPEDVYVLLEEARRWKREGKGSEVAAQT